jgi:type I restriction enzyme S subunit
VREGWRSRRLDDICEFTSGLWKGKKPPFVTVGVIRMTNFKNDGGLDDSDIPQLDVEARQFERRRLQFGDIILETSGGGPKQAVGRVALFDKTQGDFSFSNFTAALRVRDPNEVDFHFLHKFLYWTHLSGVTEGMQSHSTGIRNLDNRAYKAIHVPLPSVSEQGRIVAIIDEAFEGIATATANARESLLGSRAILESHLESVIHHTGEGVTDTVLGAQVDLLPGFAFKSAEYTELVGDVRLLRGDNIVPGALRWDAAKRWPLADAAEFSRFSLHEDDVVLAMDRPWVSAGLKHAIVTAQDLPSLLVQRVARLRCKPQMDCRFLLNLIASAAFTKHILDAQTGSGVPHISAKQIESFRFSMPTLDQQRRLAGEIDALRNEIGRLQSVYRHKVDALDVLKKSLLHEAFSGNL